MKFIIFKQVFVIVGAILVASLLYLIVAREILIWSPKAVFAPQNLPEHILGDVFRPGIALPYQYNDRKHKIEGLQGHWELFLKDSDGTFGSVRITGQRIVFGQCGGSFSSLSFSQGNIFYEAGSNSELGNNGSTWAEVNGYKARIDVMIDSVEPFLVFRAPSDSAASLFRRHRNEIKN